MTAKERLELTWIGKLTRPLIAAGKLIEDFRRSCRPAGPSPAAEGFFDNRLICGDNLPVLRALEPEFAGKIKCIYLDPPFNTGQAFDFYDDAREHSHWLSWMRDRVEVLYRLLDPDGLMWVHLDNTELHYSKVLLDEIFTRSNFVAQITYERSGSAGLGQGGVFVNTAEYLLLYRKGKIRPSGVLASRPLEFPAMKRYNRFLVSAGRRTLVKKFKARSNDLPVKLYEHEGFRIESISLRNFEKRRREIADEFARRFDRLFRTTNPQKENEFQNELIADMKPQGLYSVEYTPWRGKYKNKPTTLYYLNRELFAWLKDTAELSADGVMKTNKLTDVWVHGDIPKADLASEGGVEFKRGKKPEHLLRRIIEFSTHPGEWVLDPFAGSGTTGAVAHKLGRRWLMIESGDHCRTHILPRLKRVADGLDQSGISKSLAWKGGGGFRYFSLHPT